MKMGTSRTPFICFSLLLLMLQFEASSSSVQGSTPSPNQLTTSSFKWQHHKDDHNHHGNYGKQGDVFVDYKRKVRTGANPLHNR